MKYVVWGNLPWEDFIYKDLLRHMPDAEEVIFMGKGTEQGTLNIRFANLQVLNMPECSEQTAIVCSPFWIQQALGGGFRNVVFIMEPCPINEDRQLWDKYSGLLAEAANLVITIAEKTYLEQCLRRRNVYWWDSGHEHTEENHALLRLFMRYMNQDHSMEPLMMKQWEQRLHAYSRLDAQVGVHETIRYLAASYLYFLGRAEADEALREAFEMVLLRERSNGSLHSHYRFFSAIQTQQGDLERAVYTYAITAVLPHEKEIIARMEKWAAEDRLELLKAELYLVNDDYRRAADAGEEDGSEEADLLLADLYLDQWMWTKGLEKMERLQLPYRNGISREQVRATLLWSHNQKHEATLDLLRASMKDWNVLATFAETDLLEQACHRLKERLNHGSGS
ncbi:hypothetical protein GRF59_01525 [Paenibacillus sp. HJL G12]|uniref:Uncharacterized protein n=1 Tax=Paenibacillus dendrobii TaxID=2691084 RepID=A0A7X3IEV4_9BACL|nr:hypothetical protein [Paenibacillus dendrobii]MWV42298.1 hypothetical protein [Paenibacillus dendrobii]